MRLVYKLPVTVKVQCPPDAARVVFTVGGIKAEVDWQVDDHGYLSAVRLALLGQSVSDVEPLAPPPGSEETAFRVAAYIANSIRKQQTILDLIDPEDVRSGSPELQAETEDEKKQLATKLRSVSSRFGSKYLSKEAFVPDRLYLGKHERALAFYAHGLRAEDPFVKFELFYRVMECFFCRNVKNRAPEHLRKCPKFKGTDVTELVGRWVTLRHRSTHPWRQPELNRDDLRELLETREEARVMQGVACWLLENPPPK